MPLLKVFIYRILLATPLCFCIWYYSAVIWIWPISQSVQFIMRFLFPNLIASIEQSGHALDIVTNFGDLMEYTQHKKMIALAFAVNPLSYAYSLAMYALLQVASKNFDFKSWVLGLLILWMTIIFGISVDILKCITFDLAPPGMSYPTEFSNWQLNLLGVSYQLGYLILPSLAPLLLWAYFNREFLQEYIVISS